MDESGIISQIMPVAIDLLKDIISYFDVGYIMLLFLTGYVLIKKTRLKSDLTTRGKQYAIMVIGIFYGAIFFGVKLFELGVMEAVHYLLSLGISFFATVLFHDTVYEKASKFLRSKR